MDFVTKRLKIVAHTAVLLYYNLKAKVKEEKVLITEVKKEEIPIVNEEENNENKGLDDLD